MSFPEPISFTKTWHSKPYPFIDPSRPELSAVGKNVVITGGGSGIGNAVAVAFAKAGAKSVSIVGRSADRLKRGAEKIQSAIPPNGATKVISEVADLLVKSQIDAALQSIVAKVGKIDVFVSNAGVLQQPGPITPYDVDLFLSGVSDGIRTAFNAFQSFLPVAGSDAVMLNTSSCVATISPVPGIPAYAPGWVASDLNGHQAEAPDSPDLPGQFYLWLASDEAKFLKDKYVWVNWDAEELVKRAVEIQGSKLLNWIVEGVPM
ncbi:Short chain dehydrogenase andI [Talaromyces pinophilus]|nr:Short chain dehydrogenase andI [Talaromyces pinophilus]